MPRSERQREIFQTPIGGVATTRGWSQINSGDTTAVISTTAVRSGQAPLISPYVVSSPGFVGSGQGQVSLVVNSIVDLTSFMVLTTGGVTPTGPMGFVWWILR